VRLTGVGAKTAAASSYSDPTFPYDGLTMSVDPQTKPSVMVTVLTLDQALTSYRDQISSLGSQVNTYRDQVSSLSSQVTSLSAEVSTLTTVAYASVAVAVIAIIIAAVIGMRRRE